MTGAELIAAFRDDTGDTAVPPSWSDSEVLRGLNEGQDEAARRARLLFDSTTVSVCQATVTHDNPIVTLDPRVIFLRRARLNGQSIPLIRKRVRDMDQECPGWDSETATTTPQIYIPDYQTGAVRLYPTPKDDGTLLLTVIRLPIAPITFGGAAPVDPELPPHTHLALVEWAKYRAYLKEDEDVKDEELAKKALARFELEFGKKSSAFDERWINNNYDPDQGGLY